MKKVMMMIVSAMFLGSMAMAADAANSDNATVDQSKNPITGTKTTTKKWKKKSKTANGDSAEVNAKETTKVKKDGTTTTTDDVKASDTQKQ